MGLYNAEISAGSLMIPESRRIARLLLAHPSKAQWMEAVSRDNLLQKKSPTTARRQASLIRNRLETMNDAAWTLIADGTQEVTTQLLLAASIKHSRLLADFMCDVYAAHLRRLETHLSPGKDWETFVAECVARDHDFANFSTTTKAKLLQVVLRILAEARYLESSKNARLTPPHLHPDVVAYLKQNNELPVLTTMDMTQ